MALQSLFGASSGSASGGTYPWMQQQLQPDQKKTINTVNAGVTAPTTNTSPLQPQYTVGQKYQGSNAPVLDWNTFEQQLLQPMVNGSMPDYGGRGDWSQQLGLDIGGRGSAGIEGFDWGAFGNGPATGNLDDMGMPAYEANPNAQADRLAAYQKYVNDPNTIYDVWGDAINQDGTTSGGRDYSKTQYKRVGDQLIPISTYNAQSSSLTSDALKGAAILAAATYGLNGFEGLSGAPAAGNGAFLGEGVASGVPAWDAAAGTFPTLPGYGTEVASLANAGGASPFTGGAGAGEVAGSGLVPGTGTEGLQLGGQAAGSVYGTGGGLAIAPEAIGAATGGTGLGAMIGSSIPAGDILGGLGGALGASGVSSALSGAASQVGKTVGGSLVKDIIGKVLGGSSGGISNLGNLASLFTNHQQYNKMGDLIDQIKSIYKPDGDYAKYMGDQLARKDAAAGRNSQYGPRLAQLMGMLGDSQAKALSGLGGMMNTQQGGLNGMVGAGTRLADGMGLSDLISQAIKGMGSQGGMLVGEAGTTPSIWDRPAEDVDWESLFGGKYARN